MKSRSREEMGNKKGLRKWDNDITEKKQKTFLIHTHTIYDEAEYKKQET
jgi:hypothetical protein